MLLFVIIFFAFLIDGLNAVLIAGMFANFVDVLFATQRAILSVVF